MTALVRKQVVAVIDSRTTMVCLHAAGMITEVGVPFETLAGDFLEPPFHIHCRSIVRPWMSGFLSKTRQEANAERQRRPMKERRIGPDGEIGARIPPAYEWNRPDGYTFPGAGEASKNRPPRPDGDDYEAPIDPRRPDGPRRPQAKATWRLLVDNILEELLDLIMERMEILLFSAEESDDVWALLLEAIKKGPISVVSQLPSLVRRLLGL